MKYSQIKIKIQKRHDRDIDDGIVSISFNKDNKITKQLFRYQSDGCLNITVLRRYEQCNDKVLNDIIILNEALKEYSNNKRTHNQIFGLILDYFSNQGILKSCIQENYNIKILNHDYFTLSCISITNKEK